MGVFYFAEIGLKINTLFHCNLSFNGFLSTIFASHFIETQKLTKRSLKSNNKDCDA